MLRGGTHVCSDSSSHGHGRKMTAELMRHFSCNTSQHCSFCVHVSLHKHGTKCILFHHVRILYSYAFRDQCSLQVASVPLLTRTSCFASKYVYGSHMIPRKKTVTVSLSSINWLLSAVEASVSCGVGTELLYINWVSVSQVVVRS